MALRDIIKLPDRRLRLVSEPGLAGMEVVECSPPYDHAEQTSIIAARVMLSVNR